MNRITMSKATLTSIAIVLITTGVIVWSSVKLGNIKGASVQITAEPGTLDWYAQTALAAGQTRADIPNSTIFEPFLVDKDDGVDLILRRHNAVRGKIISSIAKPNAKQTGIITWFKFRIEERLSYYQPDICFTCQMDVPVELLPIQENEFVFKVPGGSLVVSGVELHVTNNFIGAFPSIDPISLTYTHLLMCTELRDGKAIVNGRGAIMRIIQQTTQETIYSFDEKHLGSPVVSAVLTVTQPHSNYALLRDYYNSN